VAAAGSAKFDSSAAAMAYQWQYQHGGVLFISVASNGISWLSKTL